MLRINKILVAKDFSPSSEAALRFALDLAGRTGAALHVLYVQVLFGDPFGPAAYPEEHNQRVRTRLREAVEAAAQALPGVDLNALPAVTYAVEQDEAAAPAILRYAEENDVDVVVMGTHGRRGLKHLLLGSVAEEVVRLSPVPVLTIRAAAEGASTASVSSILAPVDFSQHAREALRYAQGLADLYGARLEVLHVIEEILHPAFYNAAVYSIYDVQPDIEEEAEEHLRSLYREAIGEPGDVRFHVRSGHASVEITRFAEQEEVGLIVMATHGLTGLAHLLIGSVTEKVVRTAPCPVFTVKSFGKSLVDDNRTAAHPEPL